MAELPAGVLEAEIIDLTCRLAAGTHELLVLLGELGHRGTWAAGGALSCAAWLVSPAGTSPARQRADAAVRAFTGGGGRVAAELVIHVDHHGNTFADGTPLTDHAVLSLLPEASISLLIHDSLRRPVDASPRRRRPTRRQRRVVDRIHPECAHPGCHATVLLQHDHIQPYGRGGPTTITNLRRLGGPHNRARQEPDPTRSRR